MQPPAAGLSRSRAQLRRHSELPPGMQDHAATPQVMLHAQAYIYCICLPWCGSRSTLRSSCPALSFPSWQVRSPDRGGVDAHIAARSSRNANGSLVLGQVQECYGEPYARACFAVRACACQAGQHTLPSNLHMAPRRCAGGCFSPQYALHGDMAQLRVWDRVLSR